MKSASIPIFLLCLFFGCSKKEDQAPTNPLIGSWLRVSEVWSDCTDPGNDMTYICDPSECGTLTFTATTWSYTEPGNSSPDTGTYTVTGSTVTIIESPTDQETYTFAIAGTVLTVTVVDDSTGCTEVTTFSKI